MSAFPKVPDVFNGAHHGITVNLTYAFHNKICDRRTLYLKGCFKLNSLKMIILLYVREDTLTLFSPVTMYD